MNTSDLIGIGGIFLAIIAIIISIYQFRKYKVSPPTEIEITSIDELIERILRINYSITYYTFLKKKNQRLAFSIRGNHSSLTDKIEPQIKRSAINFPLIACKEFIELDYFKDYSSNRFFSKGLRKELKNFAFDFKASPISEAELIDSKFDFALLDQNNPVEIFLAIGSIPYRRASIRKGTYYYLSYRNKHMKAKDLKNSLKKIDAELKKWLAFIGKKHMYEKKKKTLIPNKTLKKSLQNIQKNTKATCVDIFSVKKGSDLAQELDELMMNNKS